MAINLGASAINALRLGSTAINKAYLGSTEVYSVSGYDADAAAYITAVETADGQALETGVADAINAFVVGCKSDGIWADIKASCILAGARTLSGALVPLVGSAPTNRGFVAGDYSRTLGITGDGTSDIASGRMANDDTQDDCHMAVWLSANRGTGAFRYCGASNKCIVENGSGARARVNSTTLNGLGSNNTEPGLLGVSRDLAASYAWIALGSSGRFTQSSGILPTDEMYVFSKGDTFTSATLAFYSFGEATDLPSLRDRLATLMTAIGTAIA